MGLDRDALKTGCDELVDYFSFLHNVTSLYSSEKIVCVLRAKPEPCVCQMTHTQLCNGPVFPKVFILTKN